MFGNIIKKFITCDNFLFFSNTDIANFVILRFSLGSLKLYFLKTAGHYVVLIGTFLGVLI